MPKINALYPARMTLIVGKLLIIVIANNPPKEVVALKGGGLCGHPPWCVLLSPVPPRGPGHTARVLSLTMSPDGATVASAAADETLRLWRCFELDPARRREREKASAAKSSLIHQGIR